MLTLTKRLTGLQLLRIKVGQVLCIKYGLSNWSISLIENRLGFVFICIILSLYFKFFCFLCFQIPLLFLVQNGLRLIFPCLYKMALFVYAWFIVCRFNFFTGKDTVVMFNFRSRKILDFRFFFLLGQKPWNWDWNTNYAENSSFWILLFLWFFNRSSINWKCLTNLFFLSLHLWLFKLLHLITDALLFLFIWFRNSFVCWLSLFDFFLFLFFLFYFFFRESKR